ncbi:MAG: ComF family protein [Pseudomonadota bacterium]
MDAAVYADGPLRGLWSAGRSLLKASFDELLPPTCLTCDQRTTQAGCFCSQCWKEIDFTPACVCQQCSCPMPASSVPKSPTPYPIQCLQCLLKPPPFAETVAPFLYNQRIAKAILALKYGDQPPLATQFAEHMARRITATAAVPPSEIDALVAVPLHWRRLLGRKYNQSAEIARSLAARLDIPFAPKGLTRTRATQVHRRMSATRRYQNLRGAFHCAVPPGKTVALIDDVMTSGATLQTCARALRKAGVQRVVVWVVARVGI